MKIDFSKFKKIESDGKSTTLQHPNGHSIKIAHKGLSNEHRKEIDELPLYYAKGGYAKFSQKYDPNVKKKTSSPSKTSDTMPGSTKMAEKNYTEPQDQGTDVVNAAMNKEAPPFGPLGSPEYHTPPCINPSCKSYGRPHPNCRCYGGKMGMYGGYAEGGKIEHFCSKNRPHQKDCEYFRSGGMAGESEGIPNEDSTDQNPTPMPEPEPSGTPPPDMPGPVPSSAADVNPNVEQSTDYQSSDQDQQALPADQGADVDKEISEAENAAGPISQEPQGPVQQFQQHKDTNLQQLSSESQAFNNDLNLGHIKPETYQDLFAKKDTLGKIGTIFGLLLGGAGAGLSHQPNILMQMMDTQISNDLKAQETSAVNRQNFLKINQNNMLTQAQVKHMNTETATKAYALAKTQMNYAALHKLVTDTQKLPEGPQKQQAMQTLAMMNQGVQNENFNILDRAASGAAFYKTLFGDQNTNQTPVGNQSENAPQEQQFQQKQMGLQALGPQGEKISEFQQARHYPGIPGQSSGPLTNEDRDQIHSGITFDRTLNNFRQWAKTHSGDLSPSDRNYGEALAADVQGAYRQATHGGVYKEGEANFISNIIDSTPTKFFNGIRVLPKLDAASAQNKLRLDQILKDKGFQGYPGQQQGNQTSVPNQHTSKGGKPMVQKNGKWVYK